MKLPDKVYDVLKWICLTVLPVISFCYFGLSKIWGFPYTEEIIGTISIIETAIGMLIGISQYSIYKENKKENEPQ